MDHIIINEQCYFNFLNLCQQFKCIVNIILIFQASDFSMKNYPNVEKYYKNVQKEIDGSQEILQGAKKFREAFVEKKK